MYVRILLGITLSLTLASMVRADKLIDFRRDVQPVLTARCIECHGPEKAKNDFRVDDPEMMSYYVEPGDLESSTLWNDYLVTEDPSLKMPPPSDTHHTAMTAAELATIKLWIEEGAEHDWSTPTTETEVEIEEEETATPVAELSTPYKVWLFQGLFHPAMTHLPVGLLSISLVFLVLSKIAGRQSFESAAFHCLWVGALGACIACVSGWSYAIHEGYGLNFSLDNNIDRHRWLGVILAVGALALVPVAFKAVKSEEGARRKLKLGWFIGALLIAGCVSIVGFQGGELVYGEGHYEKEFDHLFLTDKAGEIAETTKVEATEVTTSDPSE